MTIEQEISKKTRGIVTETSFFKMLATNITLSLHNLKKDLTFQKKQANGILDSAPGRVTAGFEGFCKGVLEGLGAVKERAIRAKSGFESRNSRKK